MTTGKTEKKKVHYKRKGELYTHTHGYNFRGQKIKITVKLKNLRKQTTGHMSSLERWGYLTCDPDWPAFCS